MKGRTGKSMRRDSAISRIEKTIAAHEAGVELTKRILEDKGLEDKTAEEIEKLRKKKLERAKTTLENTKSKRGS